MFELQIKYNNNIIYYEHIDGYWGRRRFNNNNTLIFYENSDGYCGKTVYDENNNLTKVIHKKI